MKREPYFDFLKSIFMLFVFYHHFYLTFQHGSYENDYFKYLNPFAELFVGLAGFMIGYIFLNRKKEPKFIQRGFKVLLSYYVVAVPVGLVLALATNENILTYTLNIFVLNANVTYIGILKFYGLIFILLPLILTVYKKSRKTALFLSILTFLISTFVYQNNSFVSPFMTYTLPIVLQWQLFFITGILLGEIHKKKKINFNVVFRYSIPLVILALFAHVTLFNGMADEKVPYHMQKLLNTLYLVPVYLYLFKWIYSIIKDTLLDRTITTIGRNSLKAFVLSEFIRFFVISLPIELLQIDLTVLQSTVFSLVIAVLLMLFIKLWEICKTHHTNFTISYPVKNDIGR